MNEQEKLDQLIAQKIAELIVQRDLLHGEPPRLRRGRTWPALLGPFANDPRLATMLLTSFGLFGLFPLILLVETILQSPGALRSVSDFTYMYGICEFASRYVWANAFLYLVPLTGWICGRFDNFPSLQSAFPLASALSAIFIFHFMTTTMIRFSTSRFIAFGLVSVMKRFMGAPNLLNIFAPGTYISLLTSLGLITLYLSGLHDEVNTNTQAQILTLYFIADWGWASHVRRGEDHPLLLACRYAGLGVALGFVSILVLNVLHKTLVVPALLSLHSVIGYR